MKCEICQRARGRARRPTDASGKERRDVEAIVCCDPCFERTSAELPDLKARYEALLASGVSDDAARLMMVDLMRKGPQVS